MYEKWDTFINSLSESDSDHENDSLIRDAHIKRRMALAEVVPEMQERFGLGDCENGQVQVTSLCDYTWEDKEKSAIVYVQVPFKIAQCNPTFRKQSFAVDLSSLTGKRFRFATVKLAGEIVVAACGCKYEEDGANYRLVISLTKFGQGSWPCLALQ
jgi:hypothetical protein